MVSPMPSTLGILSRISEVENENIKMNITTHDQKFGDGYREPSIYGYGLPFSSWNHSTKFGGDNLNGLKTEMDCNDETLISDIQHFAGSTGYGHEDAGVREALDQVFAEIFGAESVIVHAQFFSGTHAITCALFAFLRPGDELLAVAGRLYDTLEEVIGIRESQGMGSLKDFGIQYREIPVPPSFISSAFAFINRRRVEI